MNLWIAGNKELSLGLAHGVAAVAILATMIFVMQADNRLQFRHDSVSNVASEIKVEVSLAHLWLEECLTGNDGETIDSVWIHLRSADWLARAMLYGGNFGWRTFSPVSDPLLRDELHGIRDDLQVFRAATLNRWKDRRPLLFDVYIEEDYNAVFRVLLARCDRLDAVLHQTLAKETGRLRLVEILVVLGSMGFFLLVGTTFYRHVIQRKKIEARIRHLNEVLRAIRNVSHLITREKDPDRLIQRTVELLVERRGFYNSWIALLDEQGRPCAFAESGLDDNSPLLRRQIMSGQLVHCCWELLNKEHIKIIADPPTECVDCPLSRSYADRAGIAVRLEHDGILHGLLVVSTPRAYFSDTDEQNLLQELANDVALALHLSSLERKRKTTEVALLESERRYRSLVERTETGFVLLDPDGTILEVNAPYVRMLGADNAEQLIGKSLLEFAHRDYVIETRDAVKRCLQEGHITGFVMASRRADGNLVYSLINASTEQTDRGRRVAALCRDITELKQAQETLRRSEQRFQDIALSSADWIWEIDQHGRYTFTSGRVKQILGYEPEELVGRTPADLTPSEYAPAVLDAFKKAAILKHPVIDMEKPCRTRDGHIVHLLTNGVPILDSNGYLVGYRGVDRNITAEKLAKEKISRYTAQLEETNHQLEQNQKELEEFIYTVSHDLKAPIVSISGFARLVKEDLVDRLDDTNRRYLDRITTNVNIMSDLLNDLLELSRIGRTGEEMKVIDTAAIVDEIMESFSIGAGEVGVTLVRAGVLPPIVAQPQRVRQLFSNLIDNAIKYMPVKNDALVQIGYRHDIITPGGKPGAFFVRDNGDGIEEQFHRKIFDLFQRARQDGSSVGGTGVGLSIVKRIVEKHNGHLWLESSSGKGATFYFTLSLAENGDTDSLSASAPQPQTLSTDREEVSPA